MEGDIFILWAIAVGISLAIVLFLIERKGQKELYFLGNKKKIVDYYLQKLEDIERIKDDKGKKIEELKIVSKKLFNDYYGLDLNSSYQNLVDFFTEKKMDDLKYFSESMLDCYYQCKILDEKTIQELINILKKEVKNVPMGENKKPEHNAKKEIILIKEAKGHIKNKDLSSAENTYNVLEKSEDIHPSSRMTRLYDQIVELYFKKKPIKETVVVKKENHLFNQEDYKAEIYLLIKNGEDYLNKGMINLAIDSYNKIREIYSKLKKGDIVMHSKILGFYNKIESFNKKK